MLTCYILDDEQHAIDALLAMLKKKFAHQIKIIGSNQAVSKALEEIDLLNPDILFIDIEMPEMNGLDVLKHFPERQFNVIFTTAHQKYALPALKAAATDYLVKPLSPQDVFDALQKCIEQRKEPIIQKSATSHKINLSTAHEILVVAIHDIVRVEANNNYSHFYFTNRPKLIVSKTLKEFEEQLLPYDFYRVHQSHLINLKYVQAIKSNDGDYVLLQYGHKVEISRRKKVAFLNKIKLG